MLVPKSSHRVTGIAKAQMRKDILKGSFAFDILFENKIRVFKAKFLTGEFKVESLKHKSIIVKNVSKMRVVIEVEFRDFSFKTFIKAVPIRKFRVRKAATVTVDVGLDYRTLFFDIIQGLAEFSRASEVERLGDGPDNTIFT